MSNAKIPLTRFSAGTFTRTSEASYYTQPPGGEGSTFIAWASSNVLRYDAIDGTPLALFEGAQTNLCFYSEDLNQASWIKTGASISGTTATAPDGTADCCTVSFTSAAGDMVMRPVAGTADNTSYMTTVFVRRTSGTGNVRLRVVNRAGVANLSPNRAISTTWTRIEYLLNWGTGATTPEVGVINDSAGGAQTVEVWGFDVKASAACNAPTSYIRTAATTATRNQDVLTYASMPTRMASGRWQYQARPLYSSSETLLANPASFGMASALDSCIILAPTTAQAVSSGAVSFSRTGLTYSRHQAITVTPDCAAFSMTVSGATAGNGTGATGTNPSYANTYLRVGSIHNGTRPAYARIGEPYGA